MLLLNKYIKGDKSLILLLGIGTGVCGAAIAAVSPILKSREKDSAISIGIVALIGTIFSLAYTVIYSVLLIYLLKYLGSGQVQVYMKLHM